MSTKAADIQNVTLLGTDFEVIQSAKRAPNLKVDGGLFVERPLFPKSSLVAFAGVTGRWVDWTRRDRLASLTIAALVLIRGLRCCVVRPKGCCCRRFLSREAILSNEAKLQRKRWAADVENLGGGGREKAAR